jgi:hypothetical protein
VKAVVKKRKKRKKEASQEANAVGELTSQLPVVPQLTCSSDMEADAREDDVHRVHILSAAIDTFGKTGKRMDEHKGELNKRVTKLTAKDGPAVTQQASAEGRGRDRPEKCAAAAREGDVQVTNQVSKTGLGQGEDAPAPSPVRSRLPLHQVTRPSKAKLHGNEGDTRNIFRRSSPCAGPLMASSGGADETHDSGDDTLARFDKSHLGPQGRRRRGGVGAQSMGKSTKLHLTAAEWVAVSTAVVAGSSSESEPREAQSRTASARELQMSGLGGGSSRSSSVPNSVLGADQSHHELGRPVRRDAPQVRPHSSLVRLKSSEARAREETQRVTTTQDNTDGGAKLATGRSMLRGSSIAMRDGPSAARPGKERDPLGSPLGLRNGEVQRSQLLSSCSELQREALKLQREAEREREKEANALRMVQLEERLNEEFRFSRGLLVCSAGNLTVSNGFPIPAGWQTRKLGSCSRDEKSGDLRRGLRGPRKDASETKLLAFLTAAPPNPYNRDNPVTVHPCAGSGLVLMGSRLI